ncbi:hypothetical protein RHGRI_021458 [Rhododendron griersonianum]|uniref:Gnk2-homologous domain-containing protein n=1 Tax=Rhododendron griersonianum TaxID=479676 RepID=A0AAV6JNK8_9ERIC|nr:hypothetical protein RHGRI_021458 [Rhododendron griersonianum]
MATMGSWRELLFLYLILLNIESTLELGSWSDLTYFDTGSGNYSSNSTYQTNLNTLLSSLSSRTYGYGFYSSSFGDNPDKVYAIVLCRGDVDLDTCRSCINNSTIKLPKLLPNSKGAIGWYEHCMLRYSDKSMNGIKATYPSKVLYSGVNASSMIEFKQALGSLLDDLRGKAASGGALRKFVTGHQSTGQDLGTIYGLMQCTPDLSQIDCNNCLQWAARQITQLAPPPAPPPARTFARPPPSANVTPKQDNKSSTLRPTIVKVVVPGHENIWSMGNSPELKLSYVLSCAEAYSYGVSMIPQLLMSQNMN